MSNRPDDLTLSHERPSPALIQVVTHGCLDSSKRTQNRSDDVPTYSYQPREGSRYRLLARKLHDSTSSQKGERKTAVYVLKVTRYWADPMRTHVSNDVSDMTRDIPTPQVHKDEHSKTSQTKKGASLVSAQARSTSTIVICLRFSHACMGAHVDSA